VTPETIGLAHDVVDHLRLLHPQAMGYMDLTGAIEKGLGKVHMVNVPRISDDPVPGSLFVDTPLRHAFLGRSIGWLIEALGVDPGDSFSFSMTVTDTEAHLMDARLPVEESRLKYGRAFMQHLLEVEDAIRKRQDALRETMGAIGPARVAWDRDAGLLVFAPQSGPEVRFPAEILGSFAPDLQSWCWAWDIQGLEPQHARAVAGLREETLPLLTTAAFDCSESFAYTVAIAAAGFLGKKPVWRWPLSSNQQLFFLMSPE
jgi:hypothetical protein